MLFTIRFRFRSFDRELTISVGLRDFKAERDMIQRDFAGLFKSAVTKAKY